LVAQISSASLWLSELPEPSSEQLSEPPEPSSEPLSPERTVGAASAYSDIVHADCSAWPKADQYYKDNVTQTTRSDRLPRRNDDRRKERRYDNRDRRHDDKPESLRAEQFCRRRPNNVIRYRPDVVTKVKYLSYFCIFSSVFLQLLFLQLFSNYYFSI
jgi:hypothetical protein